METTWRENERGEILVGTQAPTGSRVLGAAMLGAPGLFFLYYLVRAILEYSREATGAEWLAALPGLLLVLLLFLAFAVPAWMILAGRRWISIDVAGRRFVVVRDLRFMRWTSAYSAGDVVKVGIRSAKLASGPRSSRPRSTNVVEIHLTRKRTITVSSEDEVGDAQRLSRRLAGVLLSGDPSAATAGGETAP